MFRREQKVVCIDADGAPELVLNGIYTVKDVDPSRKCWWRGVVHNMPAIYLYEVEPQVGYMGWAPLRFRPAVSRKTDISIFTQMLTPETTDA